MCLEVTVAKLSIRLTWCGPYWSWLQYGMLCYRQARKHLGPDLSFSAFSYKVRAGKEPSDIQVNDFFNFSRNTASSSEESQKRAQMGHKHILPTCRLCLPNVHTPAPLDLFWLEGTSQNHHVMACDKATNNAHSYQSDPVLNLKSWKTLQERGGNKYTSISHLLKNSRLDY